MIFHNCHHAIIGENGEINKKSKTYIYAEKVFKLMDNDRDGEICVDEFVKGYQKLKARQNSSSVTVTAYVQEVVHTKPKKTEPKPSVPTRRKSLKDGNKVKSLLGLKKAKRKLQKVNLKIFLEMIKIISVQFIQAAISYFTGWVAE